MPTPVATDCIVLSTTPPSEMCGGPGWREVAFINMTDPTHNCPDEFHLKNYSSTIRSCVRSDSYSVVGFPVNGQQYTCVCGRITGYRWGKNHHAFFQYYEEHTDEYSVDGITLSAGEVHIWTFASGFFLMELVYNLMIPAVVLVIPVIVMPLRLLLERITSVRALQLLRQEMTQSCTLTTHCGMVTDVREQSISAVDTIIHRGSIRLFQCQFVMIFHLESICI